MVSLFIILCIYVLFKRKNWVISLLFVEVSISYDTILKYFTHMSDNFQTGMPICDSTGARNYFYFMTKQFTEVSPLSSRRRMTKSGESSLNKSLIMRS